jgi:cell division protein FtsQ
MRRPLIAEPDQRYWRRRANRRVRKRRRVRSVARLSLVVLVNAVIAGVLGYAGWQVVEHVASSPEFDLERIAVAGVERGEPARIRAQVAGYVGANLFRLDLDAIETAVRRDPWVRKASVKRRLPDALEVTVIEREPCARALIDGVLHVVDRDGFVLGPSGAGLADDLPVLSGLKGLDEAGLIAALRRGAELVERLRAVDRRFSDLVSELDLSVSDRITVGTVNGAHGILLDPDRVGRNVERYVELIDEIERRVGAVDYVDLRWSDQITVKPAVRNSTGEGR